MTEKLAAELIAKANGARKKSYCPYSKKSVGAALLCADGSIFTGANIENSAFSPSVCAERVALFSAIHEGKREFLAIAVSGGDIASPPEGFTPCGVCRQTLLFSLSIPTDIKNTRLASFFRPPLACSSFVR